jgi:nucleoside 2-deoxyribosyltransferase
MTEKNLKKIYLAGPMSGYPELNFPAFHAEAARLRGLGYEVVNPAELNPNSSDWLECMRIDIRELVTCDGVAVMPGWRKSKGASLEHDIGMRLGLAVIEAVELRADA